MTRWAAVLCVLSVWWTVLGREQSRVWQSNETLWAYTAKVQPYNMWVQQNYGTALLEAKKATAACEQLQYIQRLAKTGRVTQREMAYKVDDYVTDRLLMLAYLDHQGSEVTTCRDDSVFIADLR